ncbi:hypothetical protein RG903_00390 [Thermithiobacillus tepidarius DSM 3134]|uniref:hypothetical protein n=1 Tax=Thermithiobacillus tepidarius TaxID=929 RepID=UPI000420AB03|nr:hypothetical protein [Thermithiobacillus tepidarius]
MLTGFLSGVSTGLSLLLPILLIILILLWFFTPFLLLRQIRLLAEIRDLLAARGADAAPADATDRAEEPR